MLRHSKDEYYDLTKRPSVRERIEARLEERMAPRGNDVTSADGVDSEPVSDVLREAPPGLTMDDLVELAQQALQESPDDPEAIHRLVDERWASMASAEEDNDNDNVDPAIWEKLIARMKTWPKIDHQDPDDVDPFV